MPLIWLSYLLIRHFECFVFRMYEHCRQCSQLSLITGCFRYFQPMKIVLTFKEHNYIIIKSVHQRFFN